MCTKEEMIAKQKEFNIYCAINANNWVKSVIYQGNGRTFFCYSIE